MRRMVFLGLYLGCGMLLAQVAVGPAPAQGQQADEAVRFKITNPGQALYKMAIPTPAGDPQLAGLIQEVLTNDLLLSGLFRPLDPRSFLADLQADELNMNPEVWKAVGAEGVIKSRVSQGGGELLLDCRLYEVVKGGTSVLSRQYRLPLTEARRAAHRFAAEVVKYFTGEDSFFGTQIAFGRGPSGKQEIAVMDWDGAGVRTVTTNGAHNMLPSWHPSGQHLLYTTFARGTPDLFSVPVTGGRGKRISTRPGLNTGGVWSPDGKKIAVTLSQDGNAEIYLLSPEGVVLSRLTNNPFNDLSPSWSPDGSQIAFVSDRYGTPQIWIMSATGAGQTKITRQGNYNQEPAWAPRPIGGQPAIAFSGRDENLVYDIFLVNPLTQEITRLTENRGSNQHPSWAPNGRALVYQSSRGGLFVATADGKTERQVFKGRASTPSWGPMVKP
ncbi:MAG: protein TolB [Myxococcales bacterium]|nr:protein TolB [Myxococcota bacterium]MDW8283971.1 protein TolB [Myxococcales bacterium]